jgi:hypothetical protein
LPRGQDPHGRMEALWRVWRYLSIASRLVESPFHL